ncbi:MAG: hypothetical protein M3445_10600 [Actinomycetota bacterium]|nr:hypothetical protein [Actinomycetota bacterium]
MSRSRTITAAVVIVLVVVAAVVVWQHVGGPKSRIGQALDTMPDGTRIASFTDWRAARDDLDPELSTQSRRRDGRNSRRPRLPQLRVRGCRIV